MSEHTLTLALAGNPNCGKTTVFNALTGLSARVGNWPGVTVEKKEGFLELPSKKIHIVDLPGIYGLSATSEDEMVSRDFLMSGEASLIVNIVDASNLERNLYLTMQLMETGIPVVLVLNMMDIATKRGFQVNPEALEKALGTKVLPMSALVKGDISKLKTYLEELDPKTLVGVDGTQVGYDSDMEDLINTIAMDLAKAGVEKSLPGHCSPRWLALRLLEKDHGIVELLQNYLPGQVADTALGRIKAQEEVWQEESDILVADQKYATIEGVIAKGVSKPSPKVSKSEKVDRVLLHRFFGIPFFLGTMYLVFWTTINIGGAFIDFFDLAFGALLVDGLGSLMTSLGSPLWLTTVVAGGIGSGIQTVSTFVPIIFTMFFMLAILEDSGYMARAAFVMDRLMRKIGLPGKAFVPMLVGLGCSIPAIMATRTLDSKKDKFTTIFMAPLMSCGARLPVYALFAAALFPNNAGFVVFAIYLVGLVVSILTGLLVRKTMFTGEASHFVMELPPYHMPQLGRLLSSAGERLGSFVTRAGLAISTIVLVLSLLNSIGYQDNTVTFGNEDSEQSILASIGKSITPVFGPMGISQENWPATVGLFTGLFAKEAVVGTVNALYAPMVVQEDQAQAEATPGPVPEEPAFDLGLALGEAVATIPTNLSGLGETILDPLGLGVVSGDITTTAQELEADTGTFTLMQQLFTPAAGFAYLLFILIYFPCVAALGTAIQELGLTLGWIQAGYLTVIAWSIATLWYQVAEGGQVAWILLALGLLVAVIMVFKLWGPRLAQSGLKGTGFRPEGRS